MKMLPPGAHYVTSYNAINNPDLSIICYDNDNYNITAIGWISIRLTEKYKGILKTKVIDGDAVLVAESREQYDYIKDELDKERHAYILDNNLYSG